MQEGRESRKLDDWMARMWRYRIINYLDKMGHEQREAALREIAARYGPVAFVRGSTTSKEAAERIRPVRGRMHEAIMAAITRRGPMSDRELEAALGLKHQTCSARRRELVLAGHLVAVSKRHGSTVWGPKNA